MACGNVQTVAMPRTPQRWGPMPVPAPCLAPMLPNGGRRLPIYSRSSLMLRGSAHFPAVQADTLLSVERTFITKRDGGGEELKKSRDRGTPMPLVPTVRIKGS